MPETHAPYPNECREDAIRVARARTGSLRVLATERGIAVDTLRSWVRRAEIDAGRRHEGLTTEERAEVRRLRGEGRDRREEREILLQAAAGAKETGQTRG